MVVPRTTDTFREPGEAIAAAKRLGILAEDWKRRPSMPWLLCPGPMTNTVGQTEQDSSGRWHLRRQNLGPGSWITRHLRPIIHCGD